MCRIRFPYSDQVLNFSKKRSVFKRSSWAATFWPFRPNGPFMPTCILQKSPHVMQNSPYTQTSCVETNRGLRS
jgi:hypothetical protein